MNICKNCKQPVKTVPAPPDHKGCMVVWTHVATLDQRCDLPPKYAEPEELRPFSMGRIQRAGTIANAAS